MARREATVSVASELPSAMTAWDTVDKIPEALTAAQVVATLQERGSTDLVTMIGFGSLLSEVSMRGTCPDGKNFRLGRVTGWRRVFGHPAAIFFERGIAHRGNPECSSLCAEPADLTKHMRKDDDTKSANQVNEQERVTTTMSSSAPATNPKASKRRRKEQVEQEDVPAKDDNVDTTDGATANIPSVGFVVSAFEVPWAQFPALLNREEEFDFVEVPFTPLRDGVDGEPGRGWMCVRSTDDEVLGRRGLRNKYAKWGLAGIWSGWGLGGVPGRPIFPCPVYARHCVLASQRAGVPQEAADSFLDDTFLADRCTTLRQYMENNPQGARIMNSVPPESVVGRYSG